MTITRKQIDRMRGDGRLHIDDDLAEMIIAQYGSEPEPYEYSEQDLHEQVRKMIDRYNKNPELRKPTGTDSRPWEGTPSMASLLTAKKGVTG
jgi:hypothetical protein